MFWSKIWFFLVAAAAALGIGVALVLPMPAERQLETAEAVRLDQAVRAVTRDLFVDARNRVDLALAYARREIYIELKKRKDDHREGQDALKQELHASAHATLGQLIAGTDKDKPQFLFALDAWGVVLARAGLDEKEWDDDLSGYFLVRDALRGYMRDDLWYLGGKLYRVAAAPVIAQPEQGIESYVGVLVVGREVDEPLARKLAQRVSTKCDEGTDPAAAVCDTHLAFFVRGQVVANSGPASVSADIQNEFAKPDAAITRDGFLGPFVIHAEVSSYLVVAQRLPGEAGELDAFFAVYSERPRPASLLGTLRSLVKEDLAFDRFPWLPLGGGFLAAVVMGLLLMWLESDRPLKRLVADALAFGKNEKKGLSEELHSGKHGSIARSVNLAFDRLVRDRSQTRRDLGAIYATDHSGEVQPLPSAGPLGALPTPFTPPAPSDFAFDSGPSGASSSFDYALASSPAPIGGSAAILPGGAPVNLPIPAPVERTALAAPPPVRSARAATAGDLPPLPEPVRTRGAAPAPPPITAARVAPVSRAAGPPPMPSSGDEDILATNPGEGNPRASTLPLMATLEPMVIGDTGQIVQQQSTPEGEESYFRQVYEDFVELKRKCGESTESLTFEKFSTKLAQNRAGLIAKYSCKAVRFQVYVKDGKAALKATPVKG